MKTKEQRLQHALDRAVCGMGMMKFELTIEGKIDLENQILSEIHNIINPPPVYEEVEETVGWLNIYPGNEVYLYKEKGAADYVAATTRIDCQEIKVKVRREVVQPVERSVPVTLESSLTGNVVATFDTRSDHLVMGGCRSKTGTFTFIE
jgi:hypothetical protein